MKSEKRVGSKSSQLRFIIHEHKATPSCELNTSNIEFFSLFLPFSPIFPELHHIAVKAMKTEEKNSSPKVRIAVLGNMNVGKSGKLKSFAI